MARVLKISNLIGDGGTCDYKGLDITKFVPGSQHYEVENNLCIVKTTEDTLPIHPDITEITEQQRLEAIAAYKAHIAATQPPSQEDRIKALEDAMLLQLGL